MRPLNVLFLCTGNSARSILAEALMNQLPLTTASSAASAPGVILKARSIRSRSTCFEASACRSMGCGASGQTQLGASNAPHMDFVITVCGQAACEVCPIWPGRPTTTHWSVPDPAGPELPGEDRRKPFFDRVHHAAPSRSSCWPPAARQVERPRLAGKPRRDRAGGGSGMEKPTVRASRFPLLSSCSRSVHGSRFGVRGWPNAERRTEEHRTKHRT